MKKVLFLSVCFLNFSAIALTAQLSSNEIQLGQSVEYILSSAHPIPVVDFTPLTKDFMLGGQSSSQSSQFINGVGTTTYEKSVVLFPVKEGLLEIPALKVGSEETVPLTLTVQKSGKEAKTQQAPVSPTPDVKLKASVSDKSPYIGQSIFYTLDLLNTNNLAGAEIIPAGAEGIKLSIIGQDTEQIKNNQRQIQRKYLLKSEKSGPISIQPALLNGEILYTPKNTIKGRGLFSIFNTPDFISTFSSGIRPIQIISNPIEINVQPKPTDWEGWWLPTNQVQVNLYPEIPQDIKVGDTFKVTLRLSALNVDSTDLPVPKLTNHPNFRYYPEPEERSSTVTKEGNLKSEIKVSYTIMPLSAGNLELPEIKIPWFNVQTKTTEYARFAPLTLKVSENAVVPLVKPALPVEEKQESPKQENILHSPLFWVSLGGAFLFGITLSIFFLFLFKKKKSEKKKEKPIPDFYPF